MDIFTLSFLCLLFPFLCKAETICPQSLCGTNYVSVRYPFQFNDDVQKLGRGNNCSYPGFNLRCNNLEQIVIKLPHSGDFYVRSIDYPAQVIQLYDPYGCLSGRLLNLNLSSSPFEHSYTQKYTYLSCPFSIGLGFHLPPRIHCLSNFSTWTVATFSTSLVTELTNQKDCKTIAVVQVPVVQSVQYDKGFLSTLSEDLYLAWNTPNCKKCEARRGTCGFSNSSKQETQCTYDKTGGRGKGGLELLKIIAMAIMIPAMACSILICSICVSGGRRANGQPSLTAAVMPAETRPVTIGLDELTIESYTKVVLGESMRVPGLNDSTCPICLSNYIAKETVRCIPECKHCFHADCIDEWLRLNGSCPVCRNSPSPVHTHSQHI